MSYTTLRGFGSLVGQVPADRAKICNMRGGVESYKELDPYNFSINCKDGSWCVGGAEKEPSCHGAPCQPTTSTDGPPGVPVYANLPSRINCERKDHGYPNGVDRYDIADVCNQSRDPVPCYFANTSNTSWKNRVPGWASQAWRDWVQAKLATPFPSGPPPSPSWTGPMQIGPVPAKTPNWRYGINVAQLPGAMPGSPPPLQTATPDPAAPPVAADHTMLYVGLGVGALLLVGGAVWYMKTQGKTAS